jgi:(p)ppGpp synthase/HD superfamily hydrolase
VTDGITLWQQAAAFAAREHRAQIRKDGTTPYVAHPFRVAMTVRTIFGCDDPICLAAALLHDTIEDCGTDYEDILDGFGSEVADCVRALSKDMRMPEEQRERDYDAQLERADWRAKLIKLADVYDNTCDRIGLKASRKLIGRCERAIAIANTEHGHPVLDDAVKTVRALIERVRRQDEEGEA